MNWLTQSVGDIARELPGATGVVFDTMFTNVDEKGAAAHG
ncbi:hypothetical protein EDC38_1887 [Marinimicrobium koreense]|jgi:hypothetical protein|uniref:Uncharacterized protein n=1 Tax=Marinimicrobium koreense TaxID=306545 RepID=A0A3N1NNF3_9GAMM|nr:hypothetical protein EDC38_1887 [Marinimicrobium koreense]